MTWGVEFYASEQHANRTRICAQTGGDVPPQVKLRMDLVTFGEAMVRLTPANFQRLEQATSFDVYVGGGELNVAVAAARLGVAARWVSRRRGRSSPRPCGRGA